MLDKIRDIEYLGLNVDKNKVLSANPLFNKENLEHYRHYVIERQNVLKKRQQGLPPMWTEDKIIQNNRFTNIRRENDKVSKWLIKNISTNKNLDLEDKIWRTIIFRMYNTIYTAELIDLSNIDFWNNIDKNSKLLEQVNKDSLVYTNAYRIVQVKSIYKKFYPDRHHRCHILLYFSDLRSKLNGCILDELEFNAESAYFWITHNVYGAGAFLAYQIFVDFTYIPEYPISENHFVVAGPGCRTGLDFLFEDSDGLSPEELLFWIKNNFNKIFGDNYSPEELFSNEPEENRNWNIMSIENILCEFSKYCYVLEGKHKKPRRYKYN